MPLIVCVWQRYLLMGQCYFKFWLSVDLMWGDKCLIVPVCLCLWFGFNLTAYFSVVTLWYILLCNEVWFIPKPYNTSVCLCMCICDMHMHVCIRVCMCMYIYNYVCMYVFVSVCIYVVVYVSVSVLVCIHVYMCVGDDQGFCKSSWLPILRFWR